MSTGLLLDQANEVRRQFDAEGYYRTGAIVPRELIDRAVPRLYAVINGEYETGVEPFMRHWNPGDGDHKLKKVDQGHLCDDAIFELVTHPAIGAWAAAVTGASMVQIWATQLIIKPPASGAAGNVGWHQDMQYWGCWQGEVLTCWLALNDVTAENGPMIYVPRSHEWGLVKAGDFYDNDRDRQRDEIPLPPGATWEEVPATLPAGGVAFHHNLTFHGSGPNRATFPRLGIAIHLRTNRATPTPGDSNYYVSRLDDPRVSPVIYRSENG